MPVTLVHPIELIEHEIQQSRDEGRAVEQLRGRWQAAQRDGSDLGSVAERLLDELAELPTVGSDREPDDLYDIKEGCPDWPSAGTGGRVDERVRGAWLGRAAGCLLGKPVEGIPRQGIREIAEATGNWPVRRWFSARELPADVSERWPWHRSADVSLAEAIDGMPEDDDVNYTILGLHLLERCGGDFRTDDVADLWFQMVPAGRTFTAERVAYRNLLLGLQPTETATWRNPFREWVGARIRGDIFGWVRPGDPGRAAELAYRDAVLSHTRNGIYGELFVAAASAAAVIATSVDDVIAAGLAVVPPNSRLAKAVTFAVDLASGEPDFENVVDALERRFGDQNWVHTINNTALSVAALVHAGGDFGTSITNVVAGGWDTDSNGAMVGAIAGALAGADGIPQQWTRPLHDRIHTSIAGYDGVSISDLAERTVAVAKSLEAAS